VKLNPSTATIPPAGPLYRLTSDETSTAAELSTARKSGTPAQNGRSRQE
jgi:hypothetical protein